MTEVATFRKIHLVGIGGIGMSALAYYFLEHGARVSGSDLNRSSVTDDLKKKQAKIIIGKHRAKNLAKDIDLLIYTAACKPSNPELLRARKLGVPSLSYPEVIGKLTQGHNTIAICGSHGKSTTTAMVGLMLIRAGFDPTVIVGTKVREFGNASFRHGKSKWLVVEADEWQAGYLKRWPHWPKILLITNIDREHLDLFPNLAAIKKSFRSLAERVPKDGIIIANGDDPHTRAMLAGIKKRVRFYTFRSNEAKCIAAVLRVPGAHNVSNALAVWHAGKFLKIPPITVRRSLAAFRGTWRRFEYKGALNGATVIEDYGHHPREIITTLQAARDAFRERFAKGGRLWCVFQPHQYQRTKYLFQDFTRAFGHADYLLLLDIFRVAGGREKARIIRQVHSKKLASAILERHALPVQWMRTMDDAARLLTLALGQNDVCLIIGAGDIWKLTGMLNLSR